MKEQDCKWRAFASNMAEGPFAGLRWHRGTLEAEAKYLSCCGASGLPWTVKNGGFAGGAVQRCQLQRRVSHLQYQLQLLGKHFPNFSFENIFADRAEACKIWNDWQGFLSGSICYARWGLADIERPSDAWLAALMANWRWGTQLHVVSWKNLSTGQLLPQEGFVLAPETRMIVVEGADHLWDGYYREALEQVITFADAYECLLYISFARVANRADAAQQDQKSRRSAFAQRIAKKKNQDPLTLLSDHALSRLQAMSGKTLGVQGEIERKEQPQRSSRGAVDIDIGF